MSAKFAIPARMELTVLTLLVVTAASVQQTSKENIVTKVTEQAARMDGFLLQRNNFCDIKTSLYLSSAYENNGKTPDRFRKLFENTNLQHLRRKYQLRKLDTY